MRTPDGQVYGHEEQSVTCILDGSLLSLFCIDMPAVDLECRLLVIQEDVCFTCTYVRAPHLCLVPESRRGCQITWSYR